MWRLHEKLHEPFSITLLLCVTALLWVILSNVFRSIPMWQHIAATKECARQTKITSYDATAKQRFVVCMLKEGFIEK